jgi:uncharacterized protein YbaR (Trm112 family)
MPIDKEFLDILACPLCKAPLELREKGTLEELVCTACRRAYPIEDGIPVLLPDAGVLEEETR